MSGKSDWGTFETVLVIVIFAVALGWSLGPAMWQSYKAGRLLESGVAATAKLLKVIDTGDRINTNPVVRLQLEVQAQDGTTFSAEVPDFVASAVRLQTLQPGTRLAVRYDPKDRSRVAIDDSAPLPDSP